jgi:cardiolipin synthase
MQGRIWTVPNQITLLRLGFLPLFLILIVYEHYRWALLILVLAGLSDGIDGLLARKLNQKSSIGAYLDPIADKLLLSSSFVILAMERITPWWLTIMVLSRDILLLVVAAVIILISGYRPFPPSLLGKATTFFQIVLVFGVVLAAGYPARKSLRLIACSLIWSPRSPRFLISLLFRHCAPIEFVVRRRRIFRVEFGAE